jgi:hypothetical protein
LRHDALDETGHPAQRVCLPLGSARRTSRSRTVRIVSKDMRPVFAVYG